MQLWKNNANKCQKCVGKESEISVWDSWIGFEIEYTNWTKVLKMASAKIAKVKKQTTAPKKVTENEDGRKLSDYEILTTIGKNFVKP